MGVLPKTRFHQESFALRPGDALFMHTDGLAEIHDPQEMPLGFNGLEALARDQADGDPQVFLERVFQGVEAYRASAAVGDDMTAVVATMAIARDA